MWGPGGEPGNADMGRSAQEPIAKWDIKTDVLTTRSFPATCIIRGEFLERKGHGTCSCTGEETHRSYFDVCRSVIGPSMRSELPIPEVKVCWNAENLFECKLNRKLTGLDNRLAFSDLKSVGIAVTALNRGTYWFKRTFRPDSNGLPGRTGRAIVRLLAGLRSYAGPERTRDLCKRPLAKGAVNKLRNVLATVDGLLMQLCLCFPDTGEYLNWSRIDQMINCLISLLVSDLFRDYDSDLSRMTTFEKLKKLRKAIKEQGFNPIGDLGHVDIPREMSFLKVALGIVSAGKRPVDMFRVATLSQTRASGVPPRLVYLKTLEKIKRILVEPQDPRIYEDVAGIISAGVDDIHANVLDKLGSETNRETFWSNCLGKAKISLSDSGEFFTNSNDGGKLEAARRVLSTNKSIPKRDLVTGHIVGTLNPKVDPAGECLFYWACEQFSDDELCYERNLMSVRISLVAELGKYRGITVSHLAHAVLLHVLSHVLLEYLRVIPSSESGVGAANHAWNYFKRLSHKNPNANFLFGNEEVYLFSTDWEQATDYCDHTVAQAMINRLCYNLGIPSWYRQTAMFALCAPRQVEFIDPGGRTLECFFTSRGELMGDPVVKVILHLYHLVGRFAVREQLHLMKSDKRVIALVG
nr:MAG: RNA-dependent RNA polymerase [Dracophyllum associated narna-like virus 5]